MDLLIVDDERLARQRMRDLLADRDDVRVIDSLGEGRSAVDAIRELDPDLVLLDVHMPDMTGLDVVRKVGPEQMPIVIFITAYDEYAVDAFELAALDYLTKPYDDERFDRALDRARDTLQKQDIQEFRERLETVLEGDRPESSSSTTRGEYARRISIQGQGKINVVSVEEIEFFTADRAYVEVHTGEETYLYRKSLRELEDVLDPTEFCRIHRSHIVRLDRIDAMLISGGGNCAVRLKDGRKLKVSRTRRDELEQRLGM